MALTIDFNMEQAKEKVSLAFLTHRKHAGKCLKTGEELALYLPKGLAISETEVIHGSTEQQHFLVLTRPSRDIPGKISWVLQLLFLASALSLLSLPFLPSKPSLPSMYFIHLLAIPTVCLERGFSAIHIILIRGANSSIIILVKLYPVLSIVLEVSGPMLATLISLKYAPKV